MASMARTSSDIVISAAPAEILSVIADFAAYPEWATGVRVADVKSESGGMPEVVHFVLDAAPIRDEYDLRYAWNGNRSVSWTLSEPGSMLKAMDGRYDLASVADGTRVTYQLAVSISIPMLGMLKRKAEKVVIDTALAGLKQRVEGARG